MVQREMRILVIEDEPDLREATVSFLQMDGYMATGVGSLHAAQTWLQHSDCDLIVLDLGLPDGDGLAWLQARSDLADKGVIIVSARGEAESRISGLKAGADAFLVKPVPLEELSAMVESVVRRLLPTPVQAAWKIDPVTWQLQSPEGRRLKLTHSELQILMRLGQQPGEAVGREDLIRLLGHAPETYDPRRMEIMVRRLRGKAREELGRDLPLETVHGVGYSFTAPIVR